MAAGLILDDPDRDYPSIRRAIDVTLDDGVTDDDSRMVPDRVIEDVMFLPAAEAEVIRRWSAAAAPGDLSASDRATLRQVVILLTAARIAPRVPQVSSERKREHQYTLVREKPEDVANRLRGEGLGLLETLTGETGTLTGSGSRFRAAGWSGYGGRIDRG